ncbi:rubrerythrin-like domain-containing protein [Halogeometricum borinquense]|uniref:DUF7129 domain-containing protein n=2 Tax=Halogeometricum borinquense TaxID=60847 RepID=E4NLR2_HALBP|nr:rubrerythrin-like domain-containing protein [Halogeometricum borinquense]ADQ67265.1 hypothetical protein Hbor_16970 [Halogeometricum borinquense DSM 11551]ELY28481.1 hypothetical protein C499_07460 [Halogeometricum borinquense DSM 11551]QIB74241.1 rubrerythrin-like domain-containing protein [Halogeometricum borinquense]QIQ76549.1 rubrerythrin-like domain-containing protein [Halogeometricum borinquense]RYJ13714.1 rubrerythrin-like domain-containing protein [Halogeometricum borinquense]
MVLTHTDVDPYSPTESYYECRDCGARTTGKPITTCEECGSDALFNLSVPRE